MSTPWKNALRQTRDNLTRNWRFAQGRQFDKKLRTGGDFYFCRQGAMTDAIWQSYKSSPHGDIENSDKSNAWYLQGRPLLHAGDIFKVCLKFTSQPKYLA